jgi:hypothetical protein
MGHPLVHFYPATRDNIFAEIGNEHLFSTFCSAQAAVYSEKVFQSSSMVLKRVSSPALFDV